MKLGIAILTVSDSRTADNDTSGDLLAQRAGDAGHRIAARAIISDDKYRIRAQISNWLIDPEIHAIISTGGTGLTGRDLIPEAITPLLDRVTEGFGEMFRWLSWEDIGTSALQSRAFAGSANGHLVFCLPGSTGACTLGWDRIIGPQLDSSTRPCNLVELLPRLRESEIQPAPSPAPHKS